MAFVKVSEVLKLADAANTSAIAFNCVDFNTAHSVIAVAEELQKPVIIMLYPGHCIDNNWSTPAAFAPMVIAEANRVKVPVALHMDHSSDFEYIKAAIDAGFTSVMYDGSMLSVEENMKNTREICEYAHAHGYYTKTPKLDLDRLQAINAATDVPLVLHGTSGVPDETVRECIARGMCKVNYATDLRIAFTDGVKEYLQQNPNAYDPKKYSAVGREKVKQYVMQKIKVCGSDGKA